MLDGDDCTDDRCDDRTDDRTDDRLGDGTVHRVDSITVTWDGSPRAEDRGGPDGVFSLLIITEDGARHVVSPSPAATSTIVTMASAASTLFWDADEQTLVAGAVQR